MESPRWGFIGYGAHARTNLYPSLRALHIPLSAIATRDTRRAAIAAAEQGAASSYGDHRAMLAEANLTGVFVSVGADDQAAVVADCLGAGVHVHAEKPVGMTEAEARTIADLGAENDRILSVGFMKRYAPAYRRLASLMESELGRLISFDVFFGFEPWTSELRDDSFVRLAGVHLLNLVHGLFGEVDEVHGFSTSQGHDLSLAFALRTRSGAVGTLTFVGSPAWNSEHERVQVSGTRGRATVTDLRHLEFRPAQHSPAQSWRGLSDEVRTFTSTTTPASGTEQALFTRGYAGELAAFVDAASRRGTTPTSAEDNVQTMRLCDRLLAQI